MAEDTGIEAGGTAGADEGGSAFEAITTQEQLDRVIKARVERAKRSGREAAEAEHADALEKARLYDELQEKSKSDLERAEERAKKAESALEEMRRAEQVRGWAKQAADAAGVPAALLRGSTLEELTAHAEQLKEALGAQQKYPPTPNGGKPAGDEGEDDTDKWRRIAGLR